MQSVFDPARIVAYHDNQRRIAAALCQDESGMQSVYTGKTTLMSANRYRTIRCTDTLTRIAEWYVSNCVVDENYFHRNKKDIIDCLLALAHAASKLIDIAHNPTQKKIVAIIKFFKSDLMVREEGGGPRRLSRVYTYLKNIICHQTKKIPCAFDPSGYNLLKPEAD
jgi:hypothetical protein